MNSDHVQDLVVSAFCLEAISDKPGCTTRYTDMPGKPLEDFILAAINAGKYFRIFAEDIAHNNNHGIFDYLLPALKASNAHKSPKTINLGLLEIMFPAVHARLTEDHSLHAINQIMANLKKENPDDVAQLIEARKTAWKTSGHPDKRAFVGDDLREAPSPYELYMKLIDTNQPENAHYQWGQQFKNDLPVLRVFVDALTSSSAPLTDTVACTFTTIKEHNPHLKLGIIADMCAAAIFLHLSYTVCTCAKEQIGNVI